MTVELSKLNSQDIKNLINSKTVIVIPTGSMEQHGPHLPVEVDTRLVTEIARRAAKKASTEVDVLITPPVWSGCSNHHMDFAGTLSLNQDTFIKVTKEIAGSLIHHGFKKIVLLNGHGGNATPLKLAVDQLRDSTKGDVLVTTFSYWQLIEGEVSSIRESGPGGISHSGEFETSAMLYLDDALVNKEKIAKFIPKWRTSYFGTGWYVPQSVHLGFHIKDFSYTGVYGDPTVATKEKGDKLIKVAVDKVSKFLIEFSGWEFDTLCKRE